MNFANIRKSLNISQSEIAILFGVPPRNIKNWEQGRRDPDSAAITLYLLIEGKDKMCLFLW